MTDRREWLISARAAADRKRARLSAQADRAKQAMTPATWKQRALHSVQETGENAAQTTGDALRRYRWPLAGAAMLGLAYVFRRPLARGVNDALDRLEPLIEDVETGLLDARGATQGLIDRIGERLSALLPKD